jgi:hypothetical protein
MRLIKNYPSFLQLINFWEKLLWEGKFDMISKLKFSLPKTNRHLMKNSF